MSDDIGPILKSWRYSANDLNVRFIVGEDGQSKLQIRLDLGILQLELDGRPDGLRPHNQESYFVHYKKLADARQRLNKSYTLSAVECFKLQQEAIQYYHRYLALMKLGDYQRVARDTQRNLELFDFISVHADQEDVKWSFEQYRAYVIMMHVRAFASISLKNGNFDEALAAIDRGIEQIEGYYERHGEKAGNERFEIDFLRSWADEIRNKKPSTPVEQLTRELEKAIETEQYERAAMLRDQLKLHREGK